MDDAGTGDRIVVGVDGVKVEAAVLGGELAGAASPPGYRDELVCHAVLVDGSVAAIRPIRPDDAVALAAFHEGLSTETVHRRFLGSHARLSDVELRRFTTVDYDRRLALVAERDGRWAAVARYDGAAGSDTAEVAFVVADACQHLGLGTLLLEHLAVAARRRGFTTFVADTLGTNAAMQHVFHSSGFECSQRWDSGIASVELLIHPTEAYLEAVSARELLALRRWLLPSVARQPRPSGVGRVGVACQSPPLAAASTRRSAPATSAGRRS